ncbi:Uncharacterised protein [Mycobacteroides abscessus subsp. abscessus]|nr:Uncharacterised protein [Mycobacteroides abscessus subsp. abscessus]
MTSAIDGSKNNVRYTPVSSSTTKLYMAISPSRKDQCVGKTLFSCRRTAPDGWYLESIAFPWTARGFDARDCRCVRMTEPAFMSVLLRDECPTLEMHLDRIL